MHAYMNVKVIGGGELHVAYARAFMRVYKGMRRFAFFSSMRYMFVK